MTRMTIVWHKQNHLSAHYDNAAALYHLVPLYILTTRQKRREDALCSYKVGVLDGVGPV